MLNIMKSIRYQTARDNVTYYALLAAIGAIFLGLSDEGKPFELTGSLYYVKIPITTMALVFLFSILVTRICGWDYSDKTMNYEILIGHSRKNVYWSRVITAFTICMPIGILLLVLPATVLSLMNGWGPSLDMEDTAVRILIAIAPVFRMFCECVFLTFITKSCYLGLITSFLFLELGYSILMTMDMMKVVNAEYLYLINSYYTVEKMLTFEDFSFEYINGADVAVYSASIEPTTIILVTVVSLAVSAACLILGYLYFRKSDMK